MFFLKTLLLKSFLLQSFVSWTDKKTQEGYMKVFGVFLLTSFLFGCSAPIGFDGDGEGKPVWTESLHSRIDSEEKKQRGKIKISHARGKKKRRVRPRTVSDVVKTEVPKPPPQVEEKPPWVAQLEEKVVIPKKVGKKSRRGTPEQVGQDLVPQKIQEPAEETSMSAGAPKVDIVFVVDSSNSMTHFLRKVEKTFAGFIQALNPLDWRMMFTTADYGDWFFLFDWAAKNGSAMSLEDDGELLWKEKYLTKNTENYSSIFIDTLRVSDIYEHSDDRGEQEKSDCELSPGCQGWNEQPLKALQGAFVKNRSFFRNGVDVVAIIFSDSDEGEDSEPSKRVKAEQVVESFNKELGRSGDKKLKSYGIIMIPFEDEECRKKYSSAWWGGEGIFGTELARMSKITGGSNYSICKDSYLPLARKIVADFLN